MNFTGKITQISAIQSGTSQTGNEWRRQTIVIEEATANYPNSVVVSAFNAKVDLLNGYKAGDVVQVSFDLRAKEYNGKWFNDISLYAISPAAGAQPTPMAQPVPQMQQPVQPQQPQFSQPSMPYGNDGLPF